ncbi:hypothetical protein S40288_07112, partial [Stachybotrys chartarum IBT 40288]
ARWKQTARSLKGPGRCLVDVNCLLPQPPLDHGGLATSWKHNDTADVETDAAVAAVALVAFPFRASARQDQHRAPAANARPYHDDSSGAEWLRPPPPARPSPHLPSAALQSTLALTSVPSILPGRRPRASPPPRPVAQSFRSPRSDPSISDPPATKQQCERSSVLFPDTADEVTVYLGPWEVVGSEQRRVLWQCTYQNELLEHYLPSDIPNEIHPHTLHSRHRQYDDPADLERFVTFPELQRIRYTTDEGICIHDQYVVVRYEFTSVDSSVSFQGDLRRRDLVAFYDVDVVWTNIHGRTDSFGKVKGIGAIQRLKMWRDRYTTFHSISVLANKTDGMYREYDVHLFEGELRQREDRTNQIRLNVVGRRGSMPEEMPQRRFSFHHRRRPRLRSADQSGQMGSDASPSHPLIDIRYLAIQFTHRQGVNYSLGYRQFLDRWAYAHNTDRDFQGIPFPPNHVELESPQIQPLSASPAPASPSLATYAHESGAIGSESATGVDPDHAR